MRIRTFVAAGAILLASFSMLADTPGGRAETRMVFDPVSNHIILYGGATALDKGTKVSYDLGDTWQWFGDHWVRLITPHDAGVRSGQAMVYDTNRSRIVMFGGRRNDLVKNIPNVLNDTWIFKNGDWSQLNTPNSPPARSATGAAYDPIRDRLIIFGGNTLSTDGKNTVVAIHDTWEFDGTTWTQRGVANAPALTKPTLAYDQATNQVILLGLDETSSTKTATSMYLYDANTGNWNQIKPDGLPPCVNDSHVAFDGELNALVLVGGVCADSDTTDITYTWDGTKWATLDVGATTLERAFGGAMAYDPTSQFLVQYGGSIAFGGTRVGTYALHANQWARIPDTFSPVPRSLPVAFSYPGNDAIYLYAGRDELQTYDEFWTYANGMWTQITDDNRPKTCDSPAGAYDSDRKVYEIVCEAGNVWEFDGTTWTNKKDSKDKPTIARLRSVAYDANIKKTVLFGGYDETNFLDQTWLWDGTNWTRVKKNPPTQRGQAVMWYDATMKKTIVYGGIGRQDTESRIERFGDMWSFDGSGWTNMKVDPASTPGLRYSTAYTVDPRTGHALVFGGLLYNKDSAGIETQKYVNDLWDWNGSKWTQLTNATGPDIRENSGFTFDPVSNRMVIFGGYNGRYFGDLWQFDTASKSWQQLLVNTSGSRRRTAPIPQLPPAGSGLKSARD